MALHRLAIIGLLLTAGCPSLWARSSQSLGPWRFRLDPQRVGVDERWFAKPLEQARSIRVPGCWDAQGFGDPTPLAKSNFVGWGWYEVVVPRGKRLGDRVFLCFGAVHRLAKVWVNGTPVGEHLGYITAFEFDITDAFDHAGANRITVLVDSEQHVETDGLAGCYDTYDFIKWGGLYRDVHLEWRGDAWLQDLFVRSEQGGAQVRVSAEVAGPRAEGLSARGTLRSVSGTQRFSAAGSVSADARVELTIPTPEADLWSPNHPTLYVATVELLKDGRVLDSISTRCGLREIAIRGNDIYLNGKRIFLRGYGDDACFPETVCPPANVEYWRQRFRRAREYGFTYVRHHSHVPVQEYFDAADELGFLIQPELPIAYEPHIANATPAALDLFRSQWRDMVLQYRNHPSVLTWCMGNEMGTPNVLAEELYATAKALDPTRPVCDSDGVWGAWDNPANLRDTLDLIHLQFDEWALPWGDRRGKYELTGTPPKPVTVHEMSNYVAFYDVRDADRYRGLVKPAWLTGRLTPTPEPYPSHREPQARLRFVRQLGEPWSIEWETDRLPAATGGQVAVAWTSATGFITEPSGYFTLHVNGRPLLTFNCPDAPRAVWRSDDGRAQLIFDVKQSGVDQFGVMYLVLPDDLVAPLRPLRLSVTGSASGSRRWFGLYDYTDTIAHETRSGRLDPEVERGTVVNGFARLIEWRTGEAPSVAEVARRQGSAGMLPTFVENSRKLQALCLKLNLEAARRSRGIDGYAQWLLIDYWQGGQGVLNQFCQPKGLTAEEFRRFNGETVVLLDRDRCSLVGGETLRATAEVSHFGEEDLVEPVLELSWSTVEAEPRTLARETWHNLGAVAAGVVADLGQIELAVPEVEHAVKTRLELRLQSAGDTWTNGWDFWIFPRPAPWPAPEQVGLVGGEAFAEIYPQARQVRPTDTAAADSDLLVAGSLTPPLLDSLARGQRVLLLANGSAPGETLRFKSPWWFPTPGDSNLGTIVRESPALGDFPHEGWCDLAWFELVEGSTALIHEGALTRVTPLIQVIDMPLRQQTRSLLFEARVGEGRLLATTLNLASKVIARDPAARCLFDNLVAYARSDRFDPQAALSEEELVAALAPGLDLASPVLEGFARLVAASPDPHSGQTPETPPSETAWWGQSCRTWIARQEDGARAVTWETQAVPETVDGPGVTFVWSGKLGWISEPAQGFSLALDGTPVLKFEVTAQATQWAGDEGQVRLAFQPRGVLGVDAGGVFRLYVPRDRLTPGEPVRITVAGGAGSRRWFGLHEDQDALNRTSGLR